MVLWLIVSRLNLIDGFIRNFVHSRLLLAMSPVPFRKELKEGMTTGRSAALKNFREILFDRQNVT